jgi:hypothetical protein
MQNCTKDSIKSKIYKYQTIHTCKLTNFFWISGQISKRGTKFAGNILFHTICNFLTYFSHQIFSLSPKVALESEPGKMDPGVQTYQPGNSLKNDRKTNMCVCVFAHILKTNNQLVDLSTQFNKKK